MAIAKKGSPKKKTAGRKAAKKSAAKKAGRRGMPKRQIVIKGPDGRLYVLTMEQLRECSRRNEWADEVIDAYNDGTLPLESCTIEGGVDDWDIWPTNK